MERRETSRASIAGYVVVLVGVAGWVASCFLPLYRIVDPQRVTITLYRQISFGSIGIRLGGVLYLFGGIAAIGVISIVGVVKRRRWSGAVLAGAVVAWFVASIGTLVTLFSGSREFIPGASLGIGYWCLWASEACVSAGTVIVVLSLRPPKTDEGGVAPREQVTSQPGWEPPFPDRQMLPP